MKKKYIIVIVVIIILALLFAGYKYWGWFGGGVIDPATGTKSDPSDCGSTPSAIQATDTSSGFIIGASPETQCTKPIYDLSAIPGSDELCFTADNLLLKKGDKVPSAKTIGYKTSKKWRLNRQSGNKYCYVYSPTGNYPTF